MSIAKTPEPPYYAVIFTSVRTSKENEEYAQTAERMVELAKQQKGYLGYESARNDLGITVSYWENLDDIKNWKQHTEHLLVQSLGKEKWYQSFKTRICKVERDYEFEK